jgi:hypothetical protein
MTKTLHLTYFSQGTDETRVLCENAEQAINLFRADVEQLLSEPAGGALGVALAFIELTEDELAEMQEM